MLLAVLLLTGCAAPQTERPVLLAHAAEPQHAELGWVESYPSEGQRLRFAVETLDVRPGGWSVEIEVTNLTRTSFELGVHRTQLSFGLMLFATGGLDELEDANRAGRLPPVRLAATMTPPPPDVLAAGAEWRTTLSGPGSLADRAYLRVAFGWLRAVGDPPSGMQRDVFWITDRSHRL